MDVLAVYQWEPEPSPSLGSDTSPSGTEGSPAWSPSLPQQLPAVDALGEVVGINQTCSSDCALPASGTLQFRDFQTWRFYSIFAFGSPWWPFLPWQGFPLLFWGEPEWWYERCEQLTCLKFISICRWDSIPALHFTAFHCHFVRITLQNMWFGSVCSPVLPPILRSGFCWLLLPRSLSFLQNPWEQGMVKTVVNCCRLLPCPL